jgi:hypothetical protein
VARVSRNFATAPPMDPAARASLSALTAYSRAAAGKAATSETQKATAPTIAVEYLILNDM